MLKQETSGITIDLASFNVRSNFKIVTVIDKIVKIFMMDQKILYYLHKTIWNFNKEKNYVSENLTLMIETTAYHCRKLECCCLIHACYKRYVVIQIKRQKRSQPQKISPETEPVNPSLVLTIVVHFISIKVLIQGHSFCCALILCG